VNIFIVDDYPVTSKQFRGVKEKKTKTVNPLDLKTF
jgi:propanediol dehydratase small subunit